MHDPPSRPPNVHHPVFDGVPGREPHPGFGSRRAAVGRQAGARRLGASVWEVPPGESAYPYHLHLQEEELIVVLAGEGRLRTPEGWRRIATGDVVAFPPGPSGAHQVANPGPDPLRFLAVSTSDEVDVIVYPDSGKIGVADRRVDGTGIWEQHLRSAAVPYWSGERPPG